MATLEQRAINTIRFLAVDAVQKANSGHPGLPMGAAPMAYVLWKKFLKHNPTNPNWFDRDRFILSAGHGSMLVYSLMHLAGYDLSLDDLKNFRQWGSKTPGHPEYGHTVGIETTTGPLGQGAANAVGMAMAEAFLAKIYNRDGHDIINHHTYAIVSDGDLMEGMVAEAGALAGHLKLGKLIYLYDDNLVSLADSTDITFTEDVAQRYEAYGWQVITVVDGNDTDAIADAIKRAKAETEKPSLIKIRTVIGYGSPNKAGTYSVHGSPLGTDEVKATKENLGWPLEPDFLVEDDVLAHWRESADRGKAAEATWQEKWTAYANAYPNLAAELQTAIDGNLPDGWDADIPIFEPDEKGEATRVSSGKVINAIAGRVPTFLGGDADLSPSTKTLIKGEQYFGNNGFDQRNIAYGVREHAMGAINNGMALHGGLTKPYAATFFTFSDYMRPPIRLAALMGIAPIFVFTHDSIGVGEDGPTHQPVEQLAAMRAIPNCLVIRPGDANETAIAWKTAMTHQQGPIVLVLSRQDIPTQDPEVVGSGAARGGYVFADCDDEPQAIIMATGSELHIALTAHQQLSAEGLAVRLVSLPSFELFEAQDTAYKESVLPNAVRNRVAVEAGNAQSWYRYLGLDGTFIGVGDRFGASSPAERIYQELNITPQAVVDAVKAKL